MYISNIDNTLQYIIPIRGTGLWGPIRGFISLKGDMNTVFGAVFDHKAETPGLGAEINRDFFELPFKNKKIFNDKGDFVSVTVIKGGADEDDMHGVDGISGGTITSDGVTNMLNERLKKYLPYFKKNSEKNEVNNIIDYMNDEKISSDLIKEPY